MVTFVGGAGDDSLPGANNAGQAGGNDSLQGNGGDDSLNGGAGADTMDGGIGNDTYYVDNAGDVIVEAAGNGTDTVTSSVSYTLNAGAEVEVLGYQTAALQDAYTAFNPTTSLASAGDFNFVGNNFAQNIYGTKGANVLDAGRNTDNTKGDTLTGGDGNDTYVVRNTNDAIVEAVGAATAASGNDVVFVSAADLTAAGQAVATFNLVTNQPDAGRRHPVCRRSARHREPDPDR